MKNFDNVPHNDEVENITDFSQYPDPSGHFGIHGGRFVSETLMAALEELETLYYQVKQDPKFWEEYHNDLINYVGRPTPLYHAKRKHRFQACHSKHWICTSR